MKNALDRTLRDIIDDLRKDPVRSGKSLTFPFAEELTFLTEAAAESEEQYVVNSERPDLLRQAADLAGALNFLIRRGRYGFK